MMIHPFDLKYLQEDKPAKKRLQNLMKSGIGIAGLWQASISAHRVPVNVNFFFSATDSFDLYRLTEARLVESGTD